MPFVSEPIVSFSNMRISELPSTEILFKRILSGLVLDIILAADSMRGIKPLTTENLIAELRKIELVQAKVFLVFCNYFKPKIDEYLQKQDTTHSNKQLILDNLKTIRAAICTDWTIAYHYLLDELIIRGFEFKNDEMLDDTVLDATYNKLIQNKMFNYGLPINLWVIPENFNQLTSQVHNSQRPTNFASQYNSFTYATIQEAIGSYIDFCWAIYQDELLMYGASAKKITAQTEEIMALYLDDAHSTTAELNIDEIKQAIPKTIDYLNQFYDDMNYKLADMLGTGKGDLAFKQLEKSKQRLTRLTTMDICHKGPRFTLA